MRWFRARGVRFWAVTVTVLSVGALLVGSQIAHDRGQSADWYAGFGQWLGALGSFAAAGAALWISTSDRRQALADRQRDEKQQDADLARQAGLVKVTVEMLGRRQPVGPMIPTGSIGIKNRRSERIFDIEVTEFVHQGEAVELKIERFDGFYVFPLRKESHYVDSELPGLALEPDDLLVLYQQDELPNIPGDYAAVRYTDTAGRRWEVDTNDSITRL